MYLQKEPCYSGQLSIMERQLPLLHSMCTACASHTDPGYVNLKLWLSIFKIVLVSFESSVAKGTNRDFTTSIAPFLLLVLFFTETCPARDDEVFMCSFAIVVLGCYL